jgi:hypothetical protein
MGPRLPSERNDAVMLVNVVTEVKTTVQTDIDEVGRKTSEVKTSVLRKPFEYRI